MSHEDETRFSFQENGRQETPHSRGVIPEVDPTSRWQTGEKIMGRYEIHGIKKGGMGIVYLCYDHESQKPVVLKTYQDIFHIEKFQVERFMWEAETWVRLEKHLNIVRAYCVEKIEDKPYIFLEYIAGDDRVGPELSSWIYHQMIDLPLALCFSIQFCTGMMHAQRKFEAMNRPFVHRDIKPSNIMVTRDQTVKVTDFGLVKAFQSIEPAEGGKRTEREPVRGRLGFTSAESLLGTPAYMAPEQWLGEQVDARADIYAFGCVLYEMLTGHPPFVGEEWNEYQVHHLESTPKPLPGVFKNLNTLILCCLEKKAENRYQGFGEMRDQLQKIYQKITGRFLEVDESGARLDAWDLLNKGVSLYNLGHTREAIACYDEAVRVDPQDAKLYNNRGTAHRAEGQLDQALRDFDEAIRLNPWYPPAYNNRGLVFHSLGEEEKALKDFDMAIQLSPWSPSTYNNRGLVYRAMGEYEKAIRDFDTAIQLNPHDPDPYNNRGLVLRTLGLHLRALKDFSEAIRLDPRNAKAFHNRGLAHRTLGKYEEALHDFSKAITLSPTFAKPYYYRGITHASLNQYEQALGDFTEAVRMAPLSPHAHNNLGLVYRALGQLEKALEEFNETIRLNPWFPSVYNHRGLVYHALGVPDQALENFDRAIQLDPKFADAYNNRALVLEAIHPSEALQAWQAYLQVAKGFPDPQGRLPKVAERVKSLQKKLSQAGKPSPALSKGTGAVSGKNL